MNLDPCRSLGLECDQIGAAVAVGIAGQRIAWAGRPALDPELAPAQDVRLVRRLDGDDERQTEYPD
jgi:hypothetical protein